MILIKFVFCFKFNEESGSYNLCIHNAWFRASFGTFVLPPVFAGNETAVFVGISEVAIFHASGGNGGLLFVLEVADEADLASQQYEGGQADAVGG